MDPLLYFDVPVLDSLLTEQRNPASEKIDTAATPELLRIIHREDRNFTEEDWDEQFPGRPYPKNIAEIILAKHRNGPTGTLKLFFRDDIVRFDTMATAENF